MQDGSVTSTEQSNPSPSPVFQRIANRVQNFLASLEKYVDIDAEQYLEHYFTAGKSEEIDYERMAIPFTYSFFLKNFWKAACTFMSNPPPLVETVVDAGCGSGATILAYLASLDLSSKQCKSTIQVTLIDRSKLQLELAKSIIEIARSEFQNLNIVLRPPTNIDLHDWVPQEDSVDCLLFGHVLIANRQYTRQILQKALSAVSENGRIYIIEPKKDIIWNILDEFAPSLALPTYHGMCILEPDETTLSSITAPQRRFRSRYLVLCLPQQKQYVHLVEQYFQLWKTRSLDLIEELFSPTSHYYTEPNGPVLIGLEEIKKYWESNALSGKDINIHILSVEYPHNEAVAEWEIMMLEYNEETKIKCTSIIQFDLVHYRIIEVHNYLQIPAFLG